MRVERISWGSWIIMAIAIGAVIAWLHATIGQTAIVQTNSQTEFISLLTRRPLGQEGKEYPWIRSVTVYPAMDMETPYAKASSRKAPVTYQMLVPVPAKGGWQYAAKSSLIDDPIDHYGEGSVPLTTLMANLAKDRPWISFRYAFWDEPRWTYTLWIGSSVLLIGVVWPLVVRKLAGAGYAGAPDEDEGPSYWQRFCGLFSRKQKVEAYDDGVTSTIAKASPMTLSQDDLGRIAAMEEGLRDFTKGGGEPGGEVEDKAEPEVKKLSAEPLAQAAEAPKEEPKEYGGEFYPTATHVKKKPQE